MGEDINEKANCVRRHLKSSLLVKTFCGWFRGQFLLDEHLCQKGSDRQSNFFGLEKNVLFLCKFEDIVIESASCCRGHVGTYLVTAKMLVSFDFFNMRYVFKF